MLRGRHRGLPVAIDRAIMVPVVSQDDSSPSSGSAIVPDEAVVHDYAYPPREKSPAPQDGVPIHRRRMSMISGISERPRNVTIEEPWELHFFPIIRSQTPRVIVCTIFLIIDGFFVHCNILRHCFVHRVSQCNLLRFWCHWSIYIKGNDLWDKYEQTDPAVPFRRWTLARGWYHQG